ncbi:ATP-binding cassette domain-containing protein [Proteinivorax hydrogeniformans]|uniref:ATP-binding cassette domain-containing protein n=1 Tax=Proteinivorax hydrogeniformans TaxID=1826727 RepID=A0AAU8HRM4_9FIRM
MKLEVKDIFKSFGETEVLHGISFEVESGKALGFLGRNGAGKTTTIRILMNLFKANAGEILLDGKKFVASEHQIGYLPEERGLYPKKKVLEQVIYFGQLRGLTKKEAKENSIHWLKKLGVEKYSNKKLETLSKGNQQKVQLAQTFVCNPDIVILDEPFSGLDPVNSQVLKEIIREQIREDNIVIFSSHQMNYIEEFCENIALINEGELVLKGNLKNIKRKYGNNRLTISLIGLSSLELEDLFAHKLSGLAKVVDNKEKYLVIELEKDKTKNDLLNEMVQLGLDIERFSTYEPTLEDIFVKKVGEK